MNDERRDWPTTLALLRSRGALRADPVRWRQLEALVRRAAQQPPAVQRALDARLTELADELGARCEAALAQRGAPRALAAPVITRSPLAALREHIGQTTPPTPELKSVRQHRGTWTKLAVQRRLHQSQAQVHDQAGPLNSAKLLHQVLTTMQATSPEYLHHLVSQVEALLWLEHALMGPVAPTVRPASPGARNRPAAR